MAGCVLIRVVLSRYRISLPGLQYDETLFVDAATRALPGQGVAHSVAGIPVMIFPYIGALKSWLYFPIFKLFGTDPVVVRLPVTLLVSGGLIFIYLALRDLINRPVALLVTVALCFDNSLFWLTRNDVGPSALELFLKCVALWCAARFVVTRRPGWVVGLVIALGLGVFNKLNFIWVVNATAAVSLLAIAVHRAELRRHLRALITWVVGLAVIYAGFAAYYFGNHIGTLLPGKQGGSLADLWPQFTRGTGRILSGTWFYGYALAPTTARPAIAWIVVVLFAAGALASLIPGPTRSLPVAGIALITILIVAQILDTPQATAGWHYVSIYPFVTIVAGYGAYSIARALVKTDSRAQLAVAAIALLVVAYDGLLMAKYFRRLEREPAHVAWSPAIYQLSHDLRGIPGHVYVTDWGIANPLFTLTPGTRFTELTYALEGATPDSLRGLGRWFHRMAGHELFVTHAPGRYTIPIANHNLFLSAGPHLRLLLTVNGRDGRPVFAVYSYPPGK